MPSEFPSCYFVVRESRPHTDAPHIVNVRYLSNIGGLDSAFVAAKRFDNFESACVAGRDHAMRIRGEMVDNRPAAPPETVIEVIECRFDVMSRMRLSEYA